jgi:hypothetical protein
MSEGVVDSARIQRGGQVRRSASLRGLVTLTTLCVVPAHAAGSGDTAVLPAITYVPGSTAKITQLVGERDKQFRAPTRSRTESRYGLRGTDLGYPFEHQGRLYFLFGDTVGVLDRALDSIATADEGDGAKDPAAGIRLNFLTAGTHTYLTIQPPGIHMGAFEVPTAGISLNGRMYIVVDTNHSQDWSTDRAVLTKARFPLTPSGFEPLRTLSQRPTGKFIKMALHAQPGAIAGLPTGGPFVLLWGTGKYRQSDAYLSILPQRQFEDGQGTLYYAGSDASGAPLWEPNESAAAPIIRNGTLGDLSVTWCEDLDLWLMTYDSRPPAQAGILFTYARTPWGPWSTPQVIFNAQRDGAFGKFIHDPGIQPGDGLEGPVIGKAQKDPAAVRGGSYAPYVVERWTRVRNTATGERELVLYYVLSTWNPYVVVLMTSRLRVTAVPPSTPPTNASTH